MIRKLTATAAIMGILMSSVSHAAINPKNIDESSSRDNIYKIIDKKMMKGEMGGVITSFAWTSINDNIYSASLRDIRKAKWGKDTYTEAFMSLIEEEVMLDKIKEIQAEAKRKAEERQARLYELFGLERTPMVELEFASITADLEAFNAIANWDAFPESWEDIEAMLTATSMINDEISAVQHLQADLLSIQRRLERGTHELQYKLDALQGDHDALQAEHDALQAEFDKVVAWAHKLHMRRGALENYFNHVRWAAGMPTDTNGTWWGDVLEMRRHIGELKRKADLYDAGSVGTGNGHNSTVTINGDILTVTGVNNGTYELLNGRTLYNSGTHDTTVTVSEDGNTLTLTGANTGTYTLLNGRELLDGRTLFDSTLHYVKADVTLEDGKSWTVDGTTYTLTQSGQDDITVTPGSGVSTYNITLNGHTETITEGTTVSLADFDVVGMSGDIKVSTDLTHGIAKRDVWTLSQVSGGDVFEWTGSTHSNTIQGVTATFHRGNVYRRNNNFSNHHTHLGTAAQYFANNKLTVVASLASSTDRIVYINGETFVNTSATGETWKTVADAYAVDQLASVFNSDAIDNLIVEVYETGVSTERALWSDFDREVTLNNDGTLSNVDSGAMVAKVPAIVGETYGEVVYTGSLSPSAFAGQLGGSQTLQQLTGDTSIDNNATALKVTFTIDDEEVVKYYNYKVVFGSTMDWTAVSQSDYETAIFSRDAIYYTKVGTEWHVANSHYSTVTKSGNTVTVTGKDAAVYTLEDGHSSTITVSNGVVTVTGANAGTYVDWNENYNDVVHIPSASDSGLNKTAGITVTNSFVTARDYSTGTMFYYNGYNGTGWGLSLRNGRHYERTADGVREISQDDYFNANIESVVTHADNSAYLTGLFTGDTRMVKAGTRTFIDVNSGSVVDIIEASSNGNTWQIWDDGLGLVGSTDNIGSATTRHSGALNLNINGWNHAWSHGESNVFMSAAELRVLENAMERAYDYGYGDGYKDGYKQGYADGFEDGVNSIAN